MIIRTFLKTVDAINEWVGKTVMWLFLALTASVLIDMFTRYLTGACTVWAFDVNYMIYSVNFMLAGGFCMLHEKHVRVDAFYLMMPLRAQAILEIIFYLVLLFPMTLFVLNATWLNFVQAVASKEIGIVSPWHPAVYHFKFVMPLAFFLLLIQEIAQFIRYGYQAVKGVRYEYK